MYPSFEQDIDITCVAEAFSQAQQESLVEHVLQHVCAGYSFHDLCFMQRQLWYFALTELFIGHTFDTSLDLVPLPLALQLCLINVDTCICI